MIQTIVYTSLLDKEDGSLLDCLKRLERGSIHLPRRIQGRPDRERLAIRFEQFKVAAKDVCVVQAHSPA